MRANRAVASAQSARRPRRLNRVAVGFGVRRNVLVPGVMVVIGMR